MDLDALNRSGSSCNQKAFEILNKFFREQGLEIHITYFQTEAGDTITHTLVEQSDFNLFRLSHPGIWKEVTHD